MILVACAGNFGGLLEADMRTDPFEGRDLMKDDLHFKATILPTKSKRSNTKIYRRNLCFSLNKFVYSRIVFF